MSRQRNNITRLSAETRQRICELLDDGATYDEIRLDTEVAAECGERDLVLHNNTFLAYRKGPEFDEFCKVRRKWSEKLVRKNMAALIVDGGKGSENIAKIADYEILNICIEKLQSGDELEPKELTSISRAVANYNRNRISADKEDTKREFAEREAKYQAQIVNLAAQIQQLTGQKGVAGLSEDALEEIEEKAKLL